ncbi:hypothetical protein BsWGS_12969 [Bradybaena similaris]
MAATKEAKLPKHMQDEVWMIMHMVAELGAHPESMNFSDQQFYFECEGEVFMEEIDDAIEADSPTERNDKEHKLIGVAETLGCAADLYYKEQAIKAQQTLVQEIVAHLRKKGDDMKDIMPPGFMPMDEIFQTAVMGSLYSDFKSRLEAFLGLGEDFSKIALVSHITKGVAGGLKDSSSHSINLLTCLTVKFMTDKYGDFLMRKGGLAKLVLDSPVDGPL